MRGLAPAFRYAARVTGDELGDALRAIRSSARLSAAIVLVLAIGIAASTTAFSFLDAAFLRSLPYPTAERLVALNEPQDGVEQFNTVSVSTFEELRAEGDVFSQVEGHRSPRAYRLGSRDSVRFATGVRGTPGLLRPFGVEPLHGSLAPTGGTTQGAVVLGHSLWKEKFEGDPEAVGSTVSVNDETIPVIGVMPSDFSFPGSEEFWLMTPSVHEDEGGDELYAVALLPEGLTPGDARASLKEGDGSSRLAGGLLAVEIRDEVIDRHRGAANLPWIVFGAGVVLLLLVTTNASSLVLVWNLRRKGERAVRAALGSSPPRLMRKALLECGILGLAAGALGLVAAWLAMSLFGRAVEHTLPHWLTLEVDARILLFTLLACLASVLLAGFTPSLRVRDTPLAETLKGTGTGLTGTKGEHRARRGLIGSQVAASTVLLASTLLLLGTADRLGGVDPGYPADEVLEVSFDRSDELRTSPRANSKQMERSVREALAIEGVAGAAYRGPFEGLRSDVEEGGAPADSETVPFGVSAQVVGRDYFDVLDLNVVEGQGFGDSDAPTEPAVGVVTRAASRTIWPEQSAVGQHLSLPEDGPVIRVVGVVSDRNQVLSGRDGIRVEPVEEVYLPASQALPRNPRLLLRTEGAPSELVPAVEARLNALDGRQAVTDATTLQERFNLTAGLAWSLGRVFLALTVAGLLVSALGLFGLVAHGVAVRQREIGIRLAVGADPRGVVRLMASQGLRITAKGAVAGLILSFGAVPLLGLLTYEVRLWNPMLLMMLVVTVMAVGWLASWVPARRAARVAPARVLTTE